jgi:hypothetical protein
MKMAGKNIADQEDKPKYPKTIYKNEWKGFGD